MRDRIKKIMSIVFITPLEQINDDASPDTIESWDSLKHMSLVVALEEEFDIEFKDKHIAEMLNLKIIELIIKKLI